MFIIIINLAYQKIYIKEGIKKVIVYTDYKNLLPLLLDKKLNQRQLKQSKKLTYYDSKIQYIKGIDNLVIDSLNRKANYEVAEKILKLLLKRNGNVIKRIEATENTTEVIRDYYNIRFIGY